MGSRPCPMALRGQGTKLAIPPNYWVQRLRLHNEAAWEWSCLQYCQATEPSPQLHTVGEPILGHAQLLKAAYSLPQAGSLASDPVQLWSIACSPTDKDSNPFWPQSPVASTTQLHDSAGDPAQQENLATDLSQQSAVYLPAQSASPAWSRAQPDSLSDLRALPLAPPE